MAEIIKNFEPLHPGRTMLVSVYIEPKKELSQFMLTLRSVVVDGKQVWEFHTPGGGKETVISVQDF